MELFKRFFDNKVDDLELLKVLDETYKTGFERKLKKDINKASFLATISEWRFGQFFENLTNKLHYDKRIFNGVQLTPDWTIALNKQGIVCEVLRINADDADQGFMDFEDELMEHLGKIELPYSVKLDYESEQGRPKDWNLELFMDAVRKWFTIYRKPREKMKCQEIIITIFNVHPNLHRIGVMGGYRNQIHKPHRLFSQNGRFLGKVRKYAPYLAAQQLPFIVCVHLHFDSGLTPDDVFQGLYGSKVFVGGDIAWKEFTPGTTYHDISKGLYYNNVMVREEVSGVLLLYQGKYTFFKNHSIGNKMNEANQQIFDVYGCWDNDKQ